jgi:hypothetical protein
MTKKDYILISSILNMYCKKELQGKPIHMDSIVAMFSTVLSSENSQFKPTKFYDACYKQSCDKE